MVAFKLSPKELIPPNDPQKRDGSIGYVDITPFN